jgi:hypothetical protein
MRRMSHELAWKRDHWRFGSGVGFALSVFPSIAFTRGMLAAALSLQTNNTDSNDARGIGQVVRSGRYREVAVKSIESCRIRALLSAWGQLVAIRTTLYNQIRGIRKTFGVVLAPGKGGTF